MRPSQCRLIVMRTRHLKLLRTPALLLLAAPALTAAPLPGAYFRILDAALAKLNVSALKLEQKPSPHYYPGALMVAAVLHAKAHPENPRAGDPDALALALKLGDILAAENQAGIYTARGDHHRDTYMWLEAYRLLESKLGGERRARWRRELLKLVEGLAAECADRQNRPAYTSPFGVSVNHTALFSATVHLAGRVFGNPEWEALGARILRRYAAEEQSPDGFWGEHSRNGPTTAYNFLTVTGVALYWEHSQDPAARAALRRSTDFHKYFTYPDGASAMITDDRRRHAYVSPWGHFGFSHFPDGRRYAEFLTGLLESREVGFEHLGRLAQDALYYHEGPLAPIPRDAERYARRMDVPAGIRKSGPWVVCLSGIVATQNVASRYYLDRQSSLEVFHEEHGVILSGANSKRQPELATFRERVRGQVYYLPLDSRLSQGEQSDRLSLAFNTFTADLDAGPPSEAGLPLRFTVRRKSAPEEAFLTLQLALKPGQAVETAAGRKFVPSAEAVALEAGDLGGAVRHRGWKLTWSGTERGGLEELADGLEFALKVIQESGRLTGQAEALQDEAAAAQVWRVGQAVGGKKQAAEGERPGGRLLVVESHGLHDGRGQIPALKRGGRKMRVGEAQHLLFAAAGWFDGLVLDGQRHCDQQLAQVVQQSGAKGALSVGDGRFQGQLIGQHGHRHSVAVEARHGPSGRCAHPRPQPRNRKAENDVAQLRQAQNCEPVPDTDHRGAQAVER